MDQVLLHLSEHEKMARGPSRADPAKACGNAISVARVDAYGILGDFRLDHVDQRHRIPHLRRHYGGRQGSIQSKRGIGLVLYRRRAAHEWQQALCTVMVASPGWLVLQRLHLHRSLRRRGRRRNYFHRTDHIAPARVHVHGIVGCFLLDKVDHCIRIPHLCRHHGGRQGSIQSKRGIGLVIYGRRAAHERQ